MRGTGSVLDWDHSLRLGRIISENRERNTVFCAFVDKR
jgi:hypothetical protein